MAPRKKQIEPWMLDVTEKAIEEGMPLKLIGELLGVSPKKLGEWYQEGSDDACTDDMKAAFAAKVDSSRSKAAREGIAMMRIHAMGDYRAALELLKVSDPDTWNTARKVDVQKEVHVKRDLSGLNVDELLQLQELEERAARRLLGSG